MAELTQEQFLANVVNHQMQILHNDGLYRHLRFSHGKSSTYAFELVTWRGYLCITGDMGEYVFSRTDDMFDFFRNKRISHGYWAEKCQAADVRNDISRFSQTKFLQSVLNYLDRFDDFSKEKKDEIFDEIKDLVSDFNDDDESAHCHAIHNYRHTSEDSGYYEIGDDVFCDFFEGSSFKEVTLHFDWCLNAIVWGIKMYDLAAPQKEGQANNG